MGILIGAGALLLAGCNAATTGAADPVGSGTATLHGTVEANQVQTVQAWFEYGTDTGYGSTSPTQSVAITTAKQAQPVSAAVAGLAPSTTHHYRLCMRLASGETHCGADQTVTTAGRAAVTGSGTVISEPELGYAFGGTFDAHADADGANPGGTATTSPGIAYFRLPESGSVTCLTVTGNRATIGFDSTGIDGETRHILAFVEDNGPTGDRLGHREVATAGDCPAATDADFPNVVLGGFPTPPVLTKGDFTVTAG